MKIRPLKQFRRLKEFNKLFKITDETVIAYFDTIYTNIDLPQDVVVHEMVHLKQQKEYGLDKFVKRYLNDKKFRLEMEKEAYHAQLASIKDEGLREAVRKDSLNALMSGLYGKVSKKEAEAILPKKKEENKLDVNKLV